MKHKIRVTNSGNYNAEGLALLRMALWDENGEVDHVTTVSGQRNRQNFRLGSDSQPGSMEPIPEGRYKVSGPYWAGAPGDFSASHGPGLGPVVFDITNGPGNTTRRAELRIHQDANEDDGAPGTAGCLGTQGETGQSDYGRLKRVLGWFAAHHIEDLDVDYRLGTFGQPHPEAKAAPAPAFHYTKLFANNGKIKALRDGVEQPALTMRLDYHHEKLGVAVNGVQLPADQVASLQLVLSSLSIK